MKKSHPHYKDHQQLRYIMAREGLAMKIASRTCMFYDGSIRAAEPVPMSKYDNWTVVRLLNAVAIKRRTVSSKGISPTRRYAAYNEARNMLSSVSFLNNPAHKG